MGEVDHTHQAEDDRQSKCCHQQNRADGNPVEQAFKKQLHRSGGETRAANEKTKGGAPTGTPPEESLKGVSQPESKDQSLYFSPLLGSVQSQAKPLEVGSNWFQVWGSMGLSDSSMISN